jgi:hypothetical protein
MDYLGWPYPNDPPLPTEPAALGLPPQPDGSAASPGAAGAPAARTPGGPPLLRGASLHGPLTWGKTDPGRTTYTWPVYPAGAYEVPTDLLRQVKAAGFDFIRLTVDPGPLLAFRGDRRDELDRRIVDVVGQIRRAGLDVLVDFHPIRMLKDYSADHLESLWPGGLFSAYVDMIRRCTRLLSRLGTQHIAIEPMNEPLHGDSILSRWLWQRMMERLYAAVRAESPDMTVVVTGGCGGNIDGLVQLDPRPFSRGDVRFSFHYYIPHLFTHQGVVDSYKSSRILPFTTRLAYPASPDGLEPFWQLVEERVNAAAGLPADEKADILADAHKRLEDYFRGGGTRTRIAAEFDRVTAWTHAYHLDPGRVFLGEFDVTQQGPSNPGARPQDRARWLADVRREAEARGFHWSLWALTDNAHGRAAAGMLLVSLTDPTRLDPLTLQALGLPPP